MEDSRQLHFVGIYTFHIETNARTIHQPIRIARFQSFLRQSFVSHSNALLTLIATSGCASGLINARTNHSSTRQKMDELVIECAFCEASIALARVIDRLANSDSVKNSRLNSWPFLPRNMQKSARGDMGWTSFWRMMFNSVCLSPTLLPNSSHHF